MTTVFERYSQKRRLHPLTMIYRGIMSLPQLIIFGYLAFSRGEVGNIIYLLIFALIAMMSLPFIILNYYFFYYFISPNEIAIYSGVISRRQRNIPIHRIQNIEISQSFLQRIFKLAKVNIETAGDVNTEGVLEYVSLSEAEEIRFIVNSYQNKEESSETIDNESAQSPSLVQFDSKSNNNADNPIFSMNLKDNIIHGMMRFRPILILVAGWLFSMAQQFYIIPDGDASFYEDIINNIIHQVDNFDILHLILYFLVGISIIAFLSWVLEIVMTVNKFYGFKLYRNGNKLLSEYGLLNRKKTTIPLKKLQMMVRRTNFLAERFGFSSLLLETAGLGAKSGGAEVAVPFAKDSRILQLMKDIKKFEFPEEFNPISRKSIRRSFFRYNFLMIPIVIALSFFSLNYLFVLLLFEPLLFVGAYIGWKYKGYFRDSKYIFVKQGYIVRKISIIPVEKLQTINVRQTFFQRRLGLATINIDTAATGSSGDAFINDLTYEEAIDLRNSLSMMFHKFDLEKIAP